MHINHNVTDFNLIEFNPKPNGPETDKHLARITFDNGYDVGIMEFTPREQEDLPYLGTFNMDVIKDSNIEYRYNRLTESEITAKLIEIQNL